MSVNGTKVITGECVWSFPHVFVPRSIGNGPLRYGITLLFDRDSDTFSDLKAAIMNAYEEAKAKGCTKLIGSLKLPFKDGSAYRPNDPMYSGKICVEATSQGKPGIVDMTGRPITEMAEVFGGCTGRASVMIEVYKTGGEYTGIACRLGNLQKMSGGVRVAENRASAAEDFGFSSPSFDEVPF